VGQGWAGLVGFEATWKKDRKLPTCGDGLSWLIPVGQNRGTEEVRNENLFFCFKVIKGKFPNLFEIK